MRRYIFLTAAIGIAITSCSLTGDGGVTLDFQASDSAPAAAVASRSVIATGVDVTDFLLSIREVEFKQDEADPDNPADVFFEGPYSLDLLDAAGPLTQTIGTVDVPAGTYQAVRFKLHKTTAVDAASPLYDRSIYLAGTIDGTPFEMWHDTSENLDIGEATGITVGDVPLTVTVDFDLPSFLDQSAQSADGGVLIDLTTATDGDGDGLIEINPNSDDGATNQDLADALKDNIKLVADIVDS